MTLSVGMFKMNGRRLKKPPSYKKKIRRKNQPPELIKNLLTQWKLRRKTYRLVNEKTLETNDKNEGKNRQIEINEKPPNPVGTKKESRSADGAGYYVFSFLFWVLVVTGRPHFCLVALIGLLLGRGIVGRAIGGAVLVGGEVAIGLLGLFLWKVLISFRKCCTVNAGSQVFSSLG